MKVMLNRNSSINFESFTWKNEPITSERALRDVEPFYSIGSGEQQAVKKYAQTRRHRISELV